MRLKLNQQNIIKKINNIKKMNKKECDYFNLFKVLAEITKNLLNPDNKNNFKVLKNIGVSFNVCRASIFKVHKDSSKIVRKKEWTSYGSKTSRTVYDLSNIKEYLKLINPENIILIEDINKLQTASELGKLKDILIDANVRAAIYIPIFNDFKKVVGFLGIVDTKRPRQWTNFEIKILKEVAGLLSSRWKNKSDKITQKKIFNNTGTATAIINSDGTILDANNCFYGLTGSSPKSVNNQKLYLEFVYQKDRKKVNEFIKKNRSGKIEFRIIDNSGTLKFVFGSLSYIVGKGQKVISIIDISNKKDLEKRLSKSEQLFKNNFRLSNVGMAIIDPEGNFLKINDAWCKIVGYTRKDLKKKNVIEITHPDDKQESLSMISKILSGKCDQANYIKRYIKKSGIIVWVQLNYSLVKNKEGHPLYFIAQIQDITDKKKADDSLLHRLKIEKAIAEVSRQIIWYENADLNEILKVLGKATGVDRTYIFKNNTEMNNVYEWCAEGISSEKNILQNFNIDMNPQWISKLANDNYIIIENYKSQKRIISSQNSKLLLAIPIKSMDNKLIGFIGFEDIKHNRNWSDEDIKALNIVSEMLTAFWDRKKTNKKLKRTLESTVYTLTSIVEMKDPYTAGHQERVAELAAAIGKEMGLSGDSIHNLKMIGLLHDIGKVKIPSEILTKPGRLTKKEFSLIKEHSVDGYNILKKINFGSPLARVALQHHERIDGSGYPNGLTGKEILPMAKILAVADVIEAMSSHRPYRPSLGIEKALHEIKRKKGIKYDKDIVEACVNIFKNKKFVFKKKGVKM